MITCSPLLLCCGPLATCLGLWRIIENNGDANMKITQGCFLAAPGLIAVLLLAGTSGAQEQADLSITNTATPNPATVSTSTVPRNLTYNMNVINNGPDRATGVKVTFML